LRNTLSITRGSYGRRNRQAIAVRESGVAARLRAVERAYRMAIDRDRIQAADWLVESPI